MKKVILIGVFWILAFSGSTLPASAQPVGYIYSLKGYAEIKRPQQKYKKANIHDLLEAGDSVQLFKGAVTVLCTNLTEWSVPVGKEVLLKDGCQKRGRTVLYRPDQKTSRYRSQDDDPQTPYLISPRNTALLNRQPILRWNHTGARSYQVKVTGEGLNWSTTVKQPQVIFPGNKQPIQPGSRYWVTVVAEDGKRFDSNGLSFTFLGDEQVRQVQQDVEAMKQLSLNPNSQRFALAIVYQKYGLKLEAINLLEAASKQGRQTSAITRLLGELYQESGLLRAAKDQYVKAMQVAKAENNLEGQAMLQTHLGTVYEQLGQLKDARQWLQAAKRSYEALGNVEQAQTLQLRITDLLKRGPLS